MKKLLIINEVHLKSDLRNTGHLDDQGVIGIVDNQIHSAQTDHFVQLMATLVDFTYLGMKMRVSFPPSWTACGSERLC